MGSENYGSQEAFLQEQLLWAPMLEVLVPVAGGISSYIFTGFATSFRLMFLKACATKSTSLLLNVGVNINE